MQHIASGIIVCLAMSLSGEASAWGPFGHMVVADVAWQKLSPQTRQKVSALLKQNPAYSKWISGVPADRRDEYAFMAAANWADDIKTDDAYTDNGDPASGPQAALNVGYADKLRHRYWHYIDFPFSPDGTALGHKNPANIETQIRAFRETLKSRTASAPLKSYVLVWLIHLVGDAHQPLHSTSRFTAALPRGDNGGGRISVCPETACTEETKMSLHAFWDDLPGKPASRGKVRKAEVNLAPANSAAAAIADEHQWLEESFALARNSAYAEPITAGAGPFTLTAAYKAKAKRIADERVALAGARLAHLIEDNLR